MDLYDNLMASIGNLWPDFDIENGFLDFDDFKTIMKNIAIDQGVYDGDSQSADSDQSVFFTDENIAHIFEQILEHEQEQKQQEMDGLISHSSVVDILYNVLNQIQEQQNN